MNDINSLSHTKWNCKYHIVFAPKYRRKENRSRSDPAAAMRLERGKDSRGGSMPGSCAYAHRNTTKGGGIKFHRIPQRKEQPDDL